MRVADLLLSSSRRYPSKAAIIDESRTVTYEELEVRVSKLAEVFQKDFAIQPGDCIGVWLQNRLEVIEVILAANLVGAIVELYNALWSVDVVRDLLVRGDVKILVSESKDKFKSIFFDLPDCSVISVGNLVEGAPFYDLLLEGASGSYRLQKMKSSDVAINFFTSGTTGTPKCVMHTNESIVLEELVSSTELSWRHDDVMLLSFPLYHVAGLAIFASFINGATTILTTATKAEEIASIISTYRVTRGAFIPIIIQRLLAESEKNPALDLSSLRMVSYGSSALSVNLLQRSREAFGCDFFQAYGMTETAGTVTVLNGIDHLDSTLLDSVGKPMLGASVRVVRPDGSDCSPGELGEILLRSCTMMKGYRDQPELTSRVLEGGWYHTRDSGYLDERGYLHVKGRLDGMIISGGENIFPQEIQSCILDMGASVVDAAVVGADDKKWGQCLVAFIVRKQDSDLDEEAIRDFCGEKLGRYKRPKYVYFINQIPRGGTGKVLFSELRDMHERAAAEAEGL